MVIDKMYSKETKSIFLESRFFIEAAMWWNHVVSLTRGIELAAETRGILVEILLNLVLDVVEVDDFLVFRKFWLEFLFN